MSKKKTVESEKQSKIDNTKDAMNASNGFKNVESAGTNSVGESSRNKR